MGSSKNKLTISSAEGFCQALCHLRDEAMAAGWAAPAHFIDVAAEAMQPHMFENNINSPDGTPVSVTATASVQQSNGSPKAPP